jgi:hypothetical protein
MGKVLGWRESSGCLGGVRGAAALAPAAPGLGVRSEAE